MLDLPAMIRNGVPDAPRALPMCTGCPSLLASAQAIGPARCHQADGRLIAEAFSTGRDAAPHWCPRNPSNRPARLPSWSAMV
jgi:hypothetical protein